MSTNVEIRGEQVTKKGCPAALRIEAEKTRRACAIGRECGLFEAPEVLALDEQDGVLTFARVADMRGLREVLRDKGDHSGLMSRLGRALEQSAGKRDATQIMAILADLDDVLSRVSSNPFISATSKGRDTHV